MMDGATVHVLLAEARGAAEDLLAVTGPMLVTPGTMHSLAHCILDLTTTCQHLHQQSLRWMVAAARQTPPRDVL
jgi:hypothetical protein